jgi:hypothetical protein
MGFFQSRLARFPGNRFADACEVVSLMRRPPLAPRKIPGTHLCSRHERHSAAGSIWSIKKTEDIRNLTCDLSACSIVPQPITLLLALY